MTPDPPTTRSDEEELKEVVIAFLNQYRGPTAGCGKTRVHKMVFWGELYCLHHFGRRLTDAEFKAYKFGSFSQEIQDILENAEEIETFSSPMAARPQFRATREARLSDEKLEIIDEVFEQTKGLTDPELEKFSKGSWLYENTDFDETMDFDEYREEVIITPTRWRRLGLEDRDPVGDGADTIEGIVE